MADYFFNARETRVYDLTFAGISHEKLPFSPLAPLAPCVQYSILILAKLRDTFSVRRSSPPLPPVLTELINMLSNSNVEYSRGFSPALRTVNLALGMCLPEALE